MKGLELFCSTLPSTTQLELWDQLFYQLGVVVEPLPHRLCDHFTAGLLRGRILVETGKSSVHAVFDVSPILGEELWIFSELSFLTFGVEGIPALWSELPGKLGGHPRWRAVE